MLGNADEWVAGLYREYESSATVDPPRDPFDDDLIIVELVKRGGSFARTASEVRASVRDNVDPALGSGAGFRCTDCWHGVPSNKAPVDGLVLGGLSVVPENSTGIETVELIGVGFTR